VTSVSIIKKEALQREENESLFMTMDDSTDSDEENLIPDPQQHSRGAKVDEAKGIASTSILVIPVKRQSSGQAYELIDSSFQRSSINSSFVEARPEFPYDKFNGNFAKA